MYQYTDTDQALVNARVEQFREQTARYLAGDLSEDVFLALRLQNGLYIQRHAPMLRIAIPYGTLAAYQLRRLADIARRYDRSYGHITTRQNMQLNWPKLEDVPDILAELAEVQMHAIQTSGNCIRNVTTDPMAGTVPDEAIDPRVICELVRQWSTFHPEFAFLPRKFKIAVNATGDEDRAAIEVHDIGLFLKRVNGELRFDLWVGGGLGRTPVIGKELLTDLPVAELRNWLTATLRVYNLEGRRDNKYKARIKILVNALGVDAFRERVVAEYEASRQDDLIVSNDAVQALADQFRTELEPDLTAPEDGVVDPHWYRYNTLTHRVPGHRVVLISLKRPGIAPGDISSDLMDAVADLAEHYSVGELRTTHEQNLVLPHVRVRDLPAVYNRLNELGLAFANRGLISDSIACPGLDFCSLANAPTLNLAEELQQEFSDLQEQRDIGPVEIKMSGCMNACGHHHIGHIGILGIDKKGAPWYQITLGGRDQKGAAIGQRLGPAVPADEVIPTVRRVMDFYLAQREDDEWFVDAVARLGVEPFKEVVYATN